MTVFTEVASGLESREGPIALADGTSWSSNFSDIVSVACFQTARSKGWPRFRASQWAAIGPDGAVYVCNNGGWLQFVEVNGVRTMGPLDSSGYIGGRIQRIDLDRGTVTDLYTECDGRPLRARNDLVMDGHGGFWFTDTRDPAPSTPGVTAR